MTRCKLCGRKTDESDLAYCGWCEKINADVMADLRQELTKI